MLEVPSCRRCSELINDRLAVSQAKKVGVQKSEVPDLRSSEVAGVLAGASCTRKRTYGKHYRLFSRLMPAGPASEAPLILLYKLNLLAQLLRDHLLVPRFSVYEHTS